MGAAFAAPKINRLDGADAMRLIARVHELTLDRTGSFLHATRCPGEHGIAI